MDQYQVLAGAVGEYEVGAIEDCHVVFDVDDRAYARAGDGVLFGPSAVLRFEKHQAFVSAALNHVRIVKRQTACGLRTIGDG